MMKTTVQSKSATKQWNKDWDSVDWQNEKVSDIAKRLSVSTAAVYLYCQRNGIKYKRSGSSGGMGKKKVFVSDEQLQVINWDLESADEVATRLGVSRIRVFAFRKKFGIKFEGKYRPEVLKKLKSITTWGVETDREIANRLGLKQHVVGHYRRSHGESSGDFL